MTAIRAVWRPNVRREWQPVDLVADHDSGQLVLRKVGPFWPGVFLAPRDQVRLSGPEFEVGS
jgi:hypothetical protein